MNPTLDQSRVARCQHVKADGIQCNNPSLKLQRFCYYHAQLERTFRKPHRPPQIIGVDTIAAVRLALCDTLNRVLRGATPPAEARIIIRGLQNATTLIKMDATMPAQPPAPIVTDTAALAKHVDPFANADGRGEEGEGVRAIRGILTPIEDRMRAEARAQLITEIEAEERAKAMSRYAAETPMPPSLYTMTIEEIEAEERAETEAATKAAAEAAKRAAEEAAKPRCRLVDHDTCELVDANGDSEWGKCPIQYPAHDGYSPVVTPDLARFLPAPLPCEYLHCLAGREHTEPTEGRPWWQPPEA